MEKKKFVLAISGKLRSGKNQLAEYISEELKSRGRTVSQDLFALGVKDGAKQDFKQFQDLMNFKVDRLNAGIKKWVEVLGSYTSNWGIDLSAFQQPLTEIIEEIKTLNIKDENWYENKTEFTRILLQIYGTEIFRKKVDEQYWVKQTKSRVEKTLSDFVLITDVRFPNEIEEMYSKKYELVTIRVERNTNNQIGAEHESEIALDGYKDFSYIVENNGSLEDLQDAARNIVNCILI